MPDSNPSLAHFRKKVLKNNKLAHGAKRGLNAIDITLITIGVAAVQEEIVVLAEPRLLLSAEFDSHIRSSFPMPIGNPGCVTSHRRCLTPLRHACAGLGDGARLA
jgi:hypothetical protein